MVSACPLIMNNYDDAILMEGIFLKPVYIVHTLPATLPLFTHEFDAPCAHKCTFDDVIVL